MSSGVQNALEGWFRGMEACKSEQEGLKREKEEQLYESLEGLKSELAAYRNRTSSLDGEPTPWVNSLLVQRS